MGYMTNLGGWIDVHGAGAQRSDPKTGDPANYPTGFGPQGDAIRIYNYVRLVRNITPSAIKNPKAANDKMTVYPDSNGLKIDMPQSFGNILTEVYAVNRNNFV